MVIKKFLKKNILSSFLLNSVEVILKISFFKYSSLIHLKIDFLHFFG